MKINEILREDIESTVHAIVKRVSEEFTSMERCKAYLKDKVAKSNGSLHYERSTAQSGSLFPSRIEFYTNLYLIHTSLNEKIKFIFVSGQPNDPDGSLIRIEFIDSTGNKKILK